MAVKQESGLCQGHIIGSVDHFK